MKMTKNKLFHIKDKLFGNPKNILPKAYFSLKIGQKTKTKLPLSVLLAILQNLTPKECFLFASLNKEIR